MPAKKKDSTQNAEATRKKQITFLEALGGHQWKITEAEKITGIGRHNHYHWLKTDKWYKEQFTSIPELEIDFVEGKLFELINGVQMVKMVGNEEVVYRQPPCKTSIIFYLKCKGKERGYVENEVVKAKEGERSEVILPGGVKIYI